MPPNLPNESEGSDSSQQLSSPRQVIATRIGRLRMKVSASRRNRRMPKSRLHQMNGATTVECMARMGMAEPVAGHIFVDPSTLGCFLHDPPDR